MTKVNRALAACTGNVVSQSDSPFPPVKTPFFPSSGSVEPHASAVGPCVPHMREGGKRLARPPVRFGKSTSAPLSDPSIRAGINFQSAQPRYDLISLSDRTGVNKNPARPRFRIPGGGLNQTFPASLRSFGAMVAKLLWSGNSWCEADTFLFCRRHFQCLEAGYPLRVPLSANRDLGGRTVRTVINHPLR